MILKRKAISVIELKNLNLIYLPVDDSSKISVLFVVAEVAKFTPRNNVTSIKYLQLHDTTFAVFVCIVSRSKSYSNRREAEKKSKTCCLLSIHRKF